MQIPSFGSDVFYIEREFSESNPNQKNIINREYTDGSFEQLNFGSRKFIDSQVKILNIDETTYKSLITFLNSQVGSRINILLEDYEDIFGIFTNPSENPFLSEVSPQGEKDFSPTKNNYSLVLGLRQTIVDDSNHDFLFKITTSSRGADYIVNSTGELPPSALLDEIAYVTINSTLYRWDGVMWVLDEVLSYLTNVILNDKVNGIYDGNLHYSLYSDVLISGINFVSGFINEGSFQMDDWNIAFENGAGQIEDTSGFKFSLDNRIGFYKDAINSGLAFHGAKVELWYYGGSISEFNLIRTGINNKNNYSLNDFSFDVRSVVIYQDSKFPNTSLSQDDYFGIDSDYVGKTHLRSFGYFEKGKIQPLKNPSRNGIVSGWQGVTSFYNPSTSSLILDGTDSILDQAEEEVNNGLRAWYLVTDLKVVLVSYIDGNTIYYDSSATFNEPNVTLNNAKTTIGGFTTTYNTNVIIDNLSIVLNVYWADWLNDPLKTELDNGVVFYLQSSNRRVLITGYGKDTNPTDLRERLAFNISDSLPSVKGVSVVELTEVYQINSKDSFGFNPYYLYDDSGEFIGLNYENVDTTKKQFRLKAQAIDQNNNSVQNILEDFETNVNFAVNSLQQVIDNTLFDDSNYYDVFIYRNGWLSVRLQSRYFDYFNNPFTTPNVGFHYDNQGEFAPLFSTSLQGNVIPSYGQYTHAVLNGITKNNLDEDVYNFSVYSYWRVEGANPIIPESMFYSTRQWIDITQDLINNSRDKEGILIQSNIQFGGSFSTFATGSGVFPSASNPIIADVFLVDDYTTNTLKVQIDSKYVIDTETNLLIGGEYLKDNAFELSKYRYILIQYTLPETKAIFDPSNDEKWQKLADFTYTDSQSVAYQVIKDSDEARKPLFATLTGQKDIYSGVDIINEINKDSPITQSSALIGFPSAKEENNKSIEQVHFQIDSEKPTIEVYRDLMGQMAINMVVNPNGSLLLRSVYEADHDNLQYEFNDTNIFKGTLQNVITRRSQDIYQNYKFNYDFDPQENRYKYSIDISVNENGTGLIIKAPDGVGQTLSGYLEPIKSKILVSKAYYNNPQVFKMDMDLYYNKQVTNPNYISSVDSLCRAITRIINFNVLNAWEISFETKAEPFLRGNNILKVNDLVSFNSYSITASETIEAFIKSYQVNPDNMSASVSLYSLTPPDANGFVLDYVWDGEVGSIDNSLFKFKNNNYQFKDSSQFDTYPSGGEGAIINTEYQFSDDTFADADGQKLPKKV